MKSKRKNNHPPTRTVNERGELQKCRECAPLASLPLASLMGKIQCQPTIPVMIGEAAIGLEGDG